MDDQKTPYREGCDETEDETEVCPSPVSLVSEEGAPGEGEAPTDEPEPSEDAPETEPEIVPETAFVILKHTDGRVEATTTLPGFKMVRQAGLRDLRDISHALYLDVVTTIQGKVTAQESANALQQAMVKQQIAKMTQGMKKQ